jgi:hypothetical protein
MSLTDISKGMDEQEKAEVFYRKAIVLFREIKELLTEIRDNTGGT